MRNCPGRWRVEKKIEIEEGLIHFWAEWGGIIKRNPRYPIAVENRSRGSPQSWEVPRADNGTGRMGRPR
ncbi:hypothetical protein NPIL_648611 [Nephila pilipes]|uniref:Uncharacterized protein n=1 Tax=Nephila pilipes TaxID=299642 RepID=A0A8X6NVX3_NEPPI|nr:hypothetical protein NPIL_648611 [Nephila pilipes]